MTNEAGPAAAATAVKNVADKYLPDAERSGVGLCLSGGGSRASLFHLGVLRRLNETGVLSQVSTITSVSGGSILAAHLLATISSLPAAGQTVPDFETKVVKPFEAFVRRNLRTPPIAQRLLPWNWLRDQVQIKALTRLFERYLNGARLSELTTAGPTFVFCASDNSFGVNWTFTQDGGRGLSGRLHADAARLDRRTRCCSLFLLPSHLRPDAHRYPTGPRWSAGAIRFIQSVTDSGATSSSAD